MDWQPVANKRHFRVFALILIILIVIVHIIGHAVRKHFQNPQTVQADTALRQNLSLPTESVKKYTITAGVSQTQPKTIVITTGDTLEKIWRESNLSQNILADMMKVPLVKTHLTHLKPGQTLTFTTTPNNQLANLSYNYNNADTLLIQKKEDHFSATIEKKPETETIRFKSGVIRHNLEKAAREAGLTSDMLQQLKTMFAGTLNLSKDIQPGAKFNILYQEFYIDGRKDHPGNIIAAEIENHQKKYQVVRYDGKHKLPAAYYTPNGNSVQATSSFLKVPLHYRRISSHFDYHRLDPVLHRVHPHLGVDYAAPRGTPVKSIGDGVIELRRWVRGYGNTIVIRYNTTYETLYGHLEKYARNLHVDQRVKKGQVVGYVGSTGWSTGPHLHFTVYKNGVPVNPLTLNFPHTIPIPQKYMKDFLKNTHHLLTEMSLFQAANKADQQSQKMVN